MTRTFSIFSLGLAMFSACAFGSSITLFGVAQAGQWFASPNPYSAADPFDPSEVVTHNLKGDIQPRLRLPAPDLPLSIVSTTPVKTDTISASKTVNKPAAKAHEPGLISKSIQSVMSIFDWPDDVDDKTQTSNQVKSPLDTNEPIRINIHVGIQKPAIATQNALTSEELSSLDTPWARNQNRVRRLFTLDDIKAHN